MYCSSCGMALAQGLSYCNYCGAKLSGAEGDNLTKSSEVKPEFLAFGMIAMFVFGLVAIAVLLGMMKAILRFETGPILAFALLSFLILLSIEGVFMRLLLRRKHGTDAASETTPLKGQTTRELEAGQGRVLPEHIPSVTEHTTRTLETIYSERTPK